VLLAERQHQDRRALRPGELAAGFVAGARASGERGDGILSRIWAMVVPG
jgi:hypothetical protein